MEKHDTELGVIDKQETQEPKKMRVLIHNDDYTPLEFVMDILKGVFHKDDGESQNIAKTAHEKGVGVCGEYTPEIAETKVIQVVQTARHKQYPLMCTSEEI